MKTKLRFLNRIVFIFSSVIIIACCKNQSNEPDSNLIVIDFDPDLVITKNNQELIDLDNDGSYDLKVYQMPYSGFTYPTFLLLDSSIQISDGHLASSSLDPIEEGDTIDENLTWHSQLTWTSGVIDKKAYLAIMKNDINQNKYYGWLIPYIKYYENGDYDIVIDKYAFCKLKNQILMAGQEKIE